MASEAQHCDVLVVGSGAGALAGALLAATAGLATIVIEKTDQFGGTTAYSGGGLWIPLSAPNQRASLPDSRADVDTYLDACVGQEHRELRDAYLDAGPGVIDELERNPWLEFEWRPFPDYFCEAPGAQTVGRSIYALNFDATGHEETIADLRQPLPPERGGWKEPFPTIIGGRALLARLLVALSETDAVLLKETEMQSLIVEDGRVVGARCTGAAGESTIRAARGVLLAAGGFERNDQRRHRDQAPLGADWTLGAPGGMGSALEAAEQAGADTGLLEECWWAPGLMLPDGTASFRLFERGKPGSIMVNGAGVRFANETWPYDRLGRAMVEGHASGVSHIPCWFVADADHVERYGFATARPGREVDQEWIDSGVVVRADTVEELAGRIGVPADALAATVAEWNAGAADGKDPRFGRGELAFDRFFGDASVEPNPCVGPLTRGPYWAWQVNPADLGTKGGVRCDPHGRALRPDGSVLPGLYAAGNTMASWTNHCYPGPGSPIGSCVVFAALAVRDMIG
ncbi:MAG: FAD-dependent oxidoreductase [Acidobacteriota bacterium]|nr:FAD-dependent oxidoreductase [Acidobacteriota bacterium]